MADVLSFLAEYRVFVCRLCRTGVDRRHLSTHFVKQHAYTRDRLRPIEAYHDLQFDADPEEPLLPPSLPGPVAELPLTHDGLLCQVDPDGCRYVCRRVHGMKRHCRTVHQWTQHAERGRPGPAVRARLASAAAVSETDGVPWKTVVCQRFFVAGPQSHYIAVRRSEPSIPSEWPADPAAVDIWQQIEIDRTRANDELSRAVVEDPALQTNPWLSRTRWSTYLRGFDRPFLLGLVEAPDADEMPVEHRVWCAVGRLLRTCQHNTVTATGIFVRHEIVRTEAEQRRQRVPLQAYLDLRTFSRNCRPWQQLVLFLVRTYESPRWGYRLNQTQQTTLTEFLRRCRTDTDAASSSSSSSSTGDQSPSTDDHHDDDDEEDEDDEDHVDANSRRRFLTSVEEACLDFCISLLDQQVQAEEYESPLICALALLGVSDRGWLGPERYPSILSAVIKMSRFMVVQSALSRTDQPALTAVQTMVRRFMQRGTVGPFEWMLELRSYGMKIAFTTTVEGQVGWVDDTILYRDVQFTMAEFRGFVHGLVHETRQLLDDELLFGRTIAVDPPGYGWPRLRDNPRQSQPGWNFLHDSRCPLAADGDAWLVGQVRACESLRTALFTGRTLDSVRRYRGRVRDFRTKLLLLLHLTSGQPARIPELLAVHHRNSVHHVHRGIFVEDGLVALVTRLHKGYTISGDVKIVFRYPPRAVGDLVVRYLWLALPFIERLEQYHFGVSPSPLLWPDDTSAGGVTWSTEVVRKALQHESLIGLGQALTVQTYRQLAVGISRRFLHSTDRFDGGGGGDGDGDGDEEEIDPPDADDGRDAVLDLQAAHSSHTAGMVYSRQLTEQPGEIYTVREKFRRLSIAWHQFLGFESVRSGGENDGGRSGQSGRGHKRTLSHREHANPPGQRSIKRHQWRRLRTMDPLTQLQQLFGPTSQFRHCQAAAIEAIQENRSPLLAVMPTGGGKSLLFLLPASYCVSGTTVVIVPLVSLRQDLVRRSRGLGVTCAAWDARQPPDGCRVVFVTPESALTEAFSAFLHRLRTTEQLDRVVVDECHLCLDPDPTFRPALHRLRELNTFETPSVFLTATLPPSSEPAFWQRLGLGSVPHHTFRTSTSRRNITYEVVSRSASSLLAFLRMQIASVREGRVIIYGPTVQTVESLGSQLGCPIYHARHREKEANLQQFRSARGHVVVATSALGLGIDLADIRLVVHVEPPRTLLEYGQESGRAGRDGSPSRAVIVRSHNRPCADAWMQRFVEPPVRVPAGAGSEGGSDGRGSRPGRCRRVTLDAYLDGREDRTGCETGEEMCDLCQQTQSWAVRPAQNRARKGNEEKEEEEKGEKRRKENNSDEDNEENDEEDDEDDDEDDNDDDDNDEEEEGEEEKKKKNDQKSGSTQKDKNSVYEDDNSRVGVITMSMTYDHQVAQRRAIRFYHYADRRIEARQFSDTVTLLDRWQTICFFCYPYDGATHNRANCTAPGRSEYSEVAQWLQRSIRYDKYSGCFQCGFPQSVCQGRWQPGSSDGYVRRADGVCDLPSVLYEAGAIFCTTDAASESLREELYDRAAIQPRSCEGVVRYLGRKIQLAGLETNRLFQEVVSLYGRLRIDTGDNVNGPNQG